MDKYKRLVSNTALFAVSTFSSKLLSYVLTSYHTRMVITDDYGTMDLIISLGNFLIPLVSLGISNAIIRFGLQKGVNKRELYTNGLLSVFTGFFILAAAWPLISMIPYVKSTVGNAWIWLLLFVLMSCLRTLNCQFVRAREMVRLYAVDGILCTLTNLLFNILFLSGFHLGATGIILAMICSDSCSAIFLFFVSRIWKYLKPPRVNFRLWKQMLTYSVPLISASMFWWVTSTSDKIFISAMIGTDANGLFAASYKLPTILTIVATLFTEAWQISAFTDGTKKGRAAFFSRVFGVYQSLMFMAGAGIIWLCKPVMSVFVGKSYVAGWVFIPLLTMATLFNSFDNFLNSIYMLEKRSDLSLVTMGAGAAMNLVLNAACIPLWGVQGAALATFLSYFFVFLLRIINTHGIVPMRVPVLHMMVNMAILILETLLMLLDIPGWPVMTALLVALILALNFKSLWDTVRKLLRR